MQTQELVFAGAVLFSAYLVRGIAGFGSGLISIPLLALILPLSLVVPLVVLLDYLGSAAQGLRNRSSVVWPDLLPLLPFTVAGIGGALLLLEELDPRFLSLSLGVFVIGFAVYQLMPLPKLGSSRVGCIPYGFLGGLVGTLFGTGGPFYVIYLTLRGLEKSAFRATFACYFLVDGSMRLAGYAAFGYFDAEALRRVLLAIPVAGLGLLVGGRIHTGLSAQVFKRMISVLLLGSGAALILRA